MLSTDTEDAVLPSAPHIPAGDFSATFEVTALTTGATAMIVSATIGATTRTVQITLDGKRRPSRSTALARPAVPIFPRGAGRLRGPAVRHALDVDRSSLFLLYS
jgi:hypothetical protein